jgi:hypothetical protein
LAATGNIQARLWAGFKVVVSVFIARRKVTTRRKAAKTTYSEARGQKADRRLRTTDDGQFWKTEMLKVENRTPKAIASQVGTPRNVPTFNGHRAALFFEEGSSRVRSPDFNADPRSFLGQPLCSRSDFRFQLCYFIGPLPAMRQALCAGHGPK